MKKIWNVVKTVIEELWTVLVLIWNIPVAAIEMLWLLVTDRSAFKVNLADTTETIYVSMHAYWTHHIN